MHVDGLDYIDHACIDLLTNWDKQHRASGGSLDIEWSELKRKYDDRGGARAKEQGAAAKV